MTIERELTAEQLQAEYATGKRHFHNIEIIGGDEWPQLDNLNLEGVKFHLCWFHSCTFFNVSLTHVHFDTCNLKCCTFENCNLSFSVWKDCSVESLTIKSSNTNGIQVQSLGAYGLTLDDVDGFLGYTVQ